MASPGLRVVASIVYASYALISLVQALPGVTFPFNSQVPPVARVNQPYSFVFSASTFTTTTGDITYSLLNEPAWLVLDSATRTLTGTPGRGDAGSSAFVLTAADSTGTVDMQCTLVITSDPAPQVSGDISEQLEATANLSSTDPAIVTLLPSTNFQFDFKQDYFVDAAQRHLYFYATLSNHTPLPSWLLFDSTQLTFSGMAPQLTAFPQSWNISLIASDVAGFAGAAASFTVTIGIQQLVFVPAEQNVTISSGDAFSFNALQHELFLNGLQLSPLDFQVAHASLPSWLRLDTATLAIQGIVPEEPIEQNITVSVTDKHGNSASAAIKLIPGETSFFTAQVGTIVAQAGTVFNYRFQSSLFSEAALEVGVEIPSTMPWLHFNVATNTLEGVVPSSAALGTSRAILTARSPGDNVTQSQVFIVDVQGSTVTAVASTTVASGLSSRTSINSSSTSTPDIGSASNRSGEHLKGGIIAAIVTASVAGVVLIMICLVWICRLRRRDGYKQQSPRSFKKSIFRPVAPPSPVEQAIRTTTEVHIDVEKYTEPDTETGVNRNAALEQIRIRQEQPPPQLSLALPSQSAEGKFKWAKRFSHISQASSLGVGENMIREDSNIPEWGQKVAALQKPHDSFSVPAELARMSRRFTQTLPSNNKALKRLREKQRISRTSFRPGNSPAFLSKVTLHSSRRLRRDREGGDAVDGLSTTRRTSSQISSSTRGTSILPIQASEFPMPPELEASESMVVPPLSISKVNNRRGNIRIVDRSDSIATDDRPMADKRQSFIRHRASVARMGVESPLFAHGSRHSLKRMKTSSHSADESSTGSGRQFKIRRSKISKSVLTTYSESSSLEPQPNDSRRSHAHESGRHGQNVPSNILKNHPQKLSRAMEHEHDSGHSNQATSQSWTSESMNSDDWVAELSKPRSERNFVLPGEASPTPPATLMSGKRSSLTRIPRPTASGTARQQLRQRQRQREKSSSPLSSKVPLTADRRLMTRTSRGDWPSRLGEPPYSVSTDSMLKAQQRFAAAASKRPVSVEEEDTLSGMKAEQDEATVAGSEQWDDIGIESELEDTGLTPRSTSRRAGNSQMSDLSGPAFL